MKEGALTVQEVQPANLLSIIDRVVGSGELTADKMTILERLLAMQMTVREQEREAAFASDLALLQAELPQIQKDGRIMVKGQLRSTYALTEDIDVAIRPLLSKYGFSFSFDSDSKDGKTFTLTCRLLHKMGHSETKSLLLPLDSSDFRSAIQSVNSTVTNGKRILRAMHLNLIERGKDDDGQGGDKKITEEQARDLQSLMDEVKQDIPRFLKYFEIDKISDLPAKEFNGAVQDLEKEAQMIIHDVAQGSEEWLRLRSGIPTASSFDKILTKSGNRSDSQEPYMFALLAERMMGHPRFEYMSSWMDRGVELEAKAVAKYEYLKEVDTFAIGFVTNDARTVGASPDRGVGEIGLLEVKVPKDETHAMYLLGSGSVFDKYRVQAYGQLWVSGRQWTDVISFHPEMPAAIVHTERDEPFIKLLEEAVMEFSAKLEAKALELAEKGWMPKERAQNATPAFSTETDFAYAAWSKGLSN